MKNLRIILVGGGTMGSVSPLLGFWDELKKTEVDSEFLFIGTKTGPERQVIENYSIKFVDIYSGKLRRYLDWQNIIDPLRIVVGFFQALKIIWQFKPQAIVSAGAFVAVPVVLAAKVLRKKVLIHQQDIRPGLANKILSPLADRITVTFPVSRNYFPKHKTLLIGNPVRKEMLDCSRQRGLDFFKLDPDLPTLLVLGGGTGAQFLNEVIIKALPELLQFCQIIHSTGHGKKNQEVQHPQYHNFEFLAHEMPEAMAAADLVLTRAGLGTLTELSLLGKPTIIVPIANSHQEDNAQYYKKNNAAAVIFQQFLTPEILTKTIKDLLRDPAALENFSRNIKKMILPEAGRRMVEIVQGMITKSSI